MVVDAEVNHSGVTLTVPLHVGKNSYRATTPAERGAHWSVADKETGLKQNWSKIAIALAPAIVMVSIAWEVARTSPAYNFLVEPWVMKGYEMDQE